MPRSFLSELGVGFFKGAGESYKQKRDQEFEMDKYRQQSVLRVEAEKDILKAKEAMEERQMRKIMEMNRQMAGYDANQQTADMFTQESSRSGPAVNIAEQTPFTPPVDTGMTEDEAAQVVELFGADGEPIDETEVAALAPEGEGDISSVNTMPAPLPSGRPYNLRDAISRLKPEEQAVALSYINSADKNGFTKAQRYVATRLGAGNTYQKERDKIKAEQDAAMIPANEYEAARITNGLPVMDQVKIRTKADEKSLEKYDDSVWAGADARDALRIDDRIIQSTKNFVKLNRLNTTGGPLGVVPYLKDFVTSFNAEFSAMDSAAKENVMRTIKALGSGTAISDADREFTEKAGISIMKLGDANEAQAASMLAMAQSDMEYRQFAQAAREYLNAKPAEIDKYWRQYINDNPVFDPSSTVGDIKINTSRLNWNEYFPAMESGKLDTMKSQKSSNYTPDKGMPGKPNTKKDYSKFW